MKKYKFVDSKPIFGITLIVIVLTILSVWLFGLGNHTTIFENSILSTTILSTSFFLFLTINLYRGVKLKDNLGKITDRFDAKDLKFLREIGIDGSTDLPDAGEGIAGILISIVVWFIIAIIISYLLLLFGAVLWLTILVFMAMLYWVFFRALRLVFKKSGKCKGELSTSIVYGLSYTVLYNFWIYGIIILSYYFR